MLQQFFNIYIYIYIHIYVYIHRRKSWPSGLAVTICDTRAVRRWRRKFKSGCTPIFLFIYIYIYIYIYISAQQHCTDEAQQAETVLSAVLSIYIYILKNWWRVISENGKNASTRTQTEILQLTQLTALLLSYWGLGPTHEPEDILTISLQLQVHHTDASSGFFRFPDGTTTVYI